MPHITTCPGCGRAYEECSEEWANREDRRCLDCYQEMLATAHELHSLNQLHLARSVIAKTKQ